jgi:hypothetical protein
MTLDEARKLDRGGVITSVGIAAVFVRYGADVGSKATSPGDLELE